MGKVPMPTGTYREDWAGWNAFWRYRGSLRFFTPQEEKGIPVPRTSSKRYHSKKNSGKTGVIANSHVVSHRYMDEGEKGPSLRREIKRKEKILVRSEIAEGFRDWVMSDDVA